MRDGLCLLVPYARAVDPELADDAAVLQLAVSQDGIPDWRRRDQLHEDVRRPMGLGHALQERRDRAAVDVIPAALALRLQDVALAELRVRRDRSRLETRLAGVERVDVG